MTRRIRRSLCVSLIGCLLTGVVGAQDGPVQVKNPTFWLGAVAVNGTAIAGAPVDHVTVLPGDLLMCKAYLSDWSPAGQQLRAYQAELDYATFFTGAKGKVQPPQMEELRAAEKENKVNAYIDENDPDYVHAGIKGVVITDTMSVPGYRWLTVLLDGDLAPVSRQDGKKYYLGTVILEVSADAEGEFKINFVTNPLTSGLLDYNNQYIEPIDYRPLTVVVQPGAVRLDLRASDPPDAAVDARVALGPDGKAATSWNSIKVAFNADASGVSTSDFRLDTKNADAPKLTRITHDGKFVTLELDRGIRSGAWTTITYVPTGSRIRLGALPGDVNNDGATDLKDFHFMLGALGGGQKGELFQVDLDRNGQGPRPGDLAVLVETLASGQRLRLAN